MLNAKYNLAITGKTYDCLTKSKCTPYVNLFVRVSDYCDLNCPFCSFSSKSKDHFSVEFLALCMELISYKNVKINRISFTGGEPGDFSELVQDACEYIRRIYPKVFIIVNTRKGIDINPDFVDNISVSRHSIQDANVADIVKTYKDKVHVSCVLQKGVVDSPQSIVEFTQHYMKQGVNDFGFVRLMQCNAYSTEHYVAPSMPSEFIQTTELSMKGCSCNNYIYPKGNIPTIYYRGVNSEQCDNSGNLVLDIHHLRKGFNGEIILTEGGCNGSD